MYYNVSRTRVILTRALKGRIPGSAWYADHFATYRRNPQLITLDIGIGESLRGNAMDFVDSATGTAQTGHGAAVKGDQEMETGMANMENRAAPVGAAPNGVAPGAGVGTGAGAAAATNATGATGPGVTGGSTGTYPPGSSTGY